MRLFTVLLSAILIMSPAQVLAFDEAEARQLIAEKINTWATSPEIIAAVKKQNEISAGYDQAKIDELDARWKAGDMALINGILATPASKILKKAVDDSDSLFTEIFVMDARGLNVAQSDRTSDYWQGDEAKFFKTFHTGPDAINIGELEIDDSTRTYSRQLSFTLHDGAISIGAVTIGLNADKLK